MDEEKSLPESSTVSINSDQWQQLSPDNNSSPENVTDNSDNDNDTVNLSTNIPENLVFTNHTDIVRDVIVVGAGISGLSAAKLLYESGFDVLVLEARERVGGRTYTKRDPKVDYVDLGGAYVGPGQNRVLRLIHELGLQTYKINEKEYLLHYRDGKTMRFNRDKLPYGRSLLEKLDQNNFFRLIDKMGEQIPANEPWNAPNAKQWDTITFQQFVERNVWTKGVKSLAKTIIACFVTNEAYESSLLWFLWYIKQCGGLTPILSTTDGAQERKIIGGSMQISEKIADKMGNERVLLNKPTVGIRYDNDTKISCVQTLDGAQYKARHVILALAPPMQMRIHFTPSLPPLRNQLMQRCPMGSAIKSIVYYEKPFWREKGFCGSMFLEGKDDDSDCVTLSFTYDDTKYDGKNPAIVGFIVADIARRMSTLTKEERLRRICKSFSIALNTDEALRPIHYEEHIWMGEQYSGGCYTIACPPGFLTQFGRLMREPINNIHFAGTETATFCSGYMEGGIEAGERAAREILHVRGYISKDEIWQLEPPSKIVPPVGEYRPTFWERNAPSVGDLFKYMGLTLFGGLIVARVVTVHKIGAFKFECPKFQHLNMNGVTSVFRKP